MIAMTPAPSNHPVDGAVLWIDAAKASRLATSELAYRTTYDALQLHALGEFDQPLKPYVRPGGRAAEFERGRLICMPAYLGGQYQALGAKLVTGFPANVARGLPRASSV